jgi:hypothetical protein
MIKFYSKNLRRFSLAVAASAALFFSSAEKAQAQMPPNADFAFGNFNNWKCWKGISQTGTAATGAAFGSGVVTTPIGGTAPGPTTVGKSRHAITSGTATDYYGGFPVTAPGGGLFSMRIGNDSPSSRADRVQYFVHVSTGTPNLNLTIAYAAVLQDGAHPPAGQSTFQVIAYDSATGTVLPKGNNLYIAKWAIPGFSPFVNPVTSAIDSSIAWLPWTASTLNLSGMGGRTVTIEVTALDCVYGGHWAYGYFDVTSASEFWEAELMGYNSKGDSATLKAPPGYKYYRWYNQNYSKVFNGPNDTSRTIKVPAPAVTEHYNCILTPYASIGSKDTIPSPDLQKQGGGVSVVTAPWAAMSIYPNPATTSLNISFPVPFEGSVSLVNVAGATVYNEKLLNTQSHTIQTARFAAGVYTLVLTDKDRVAVARKVNIRQ